MLEKNNHTIIFFLILSLLFHLAVFFHYRRWTPVVNLDKILAAKKKEPIPVSIIELPRQKKKPAAKPQKSRLKSNQNRQVKKETQPQERPPGSGIDQRNLPGKGVVAIPKPRPRPVPPPKPAARKSVAKKAVAKKPPPKKKVVRQPIGEGVIKEKPVQPRKEPETKKKEELAKSPAKKLFPSYDELTKIDREMTRRQEATRLRQKLAPGNSLQLNTEKYKFYSYYANLKRKIELVWEYPYLAREAGMQGRLLVRFVINRDGSLGEAKILRSSGYPLLDKEALRAVHDAAPFPPLPARMEVDRLVITATFEYLLNYKVIH